MMKFKIDLLLQILLSLLVQKVDKVKTFRSDHNKLMLVQMARVKLQVKWVHCLVLIQRKATCSYKPKIMALKKKRKKSRSIQKVKMMSKKMKWHSGVKGLISQETKCSIKSSS